MEITSYCKFGVDNVNHFQPFHETLYSDQTQQLQCQNVSV